MFIFRNICNLSELRVCKNRNIKSSKLNRQRGLKRLKVKAIIRLRDIRQVGDVGAASGALFDLMLQAASLKGRRRQSVFIITELGAQSLKMNPRYVFVKLW